MTACDVTARTDFTVRRTNPLEEIARKVEGLVTDVIRDEEERVEELRVAIRQLRALEKKRIDPFTFYIDMPERLLWNWALDELDKALANLESKIADIENAAHEFADVVTRVLEGLGNPATLNDVASLLREGVADMCSELAPQVSLQHLSVDNAWDSEAAERYTERAQLQRDEGLERLAERAASLADSLEGHCITELEFWDEVAGLTIEIAIFFAGVFLTLASLAASLAGLALAAPTGGVSLIVSALGVVFSVGGLLVTGVSGFMIYKSIEELFEDTEASLSATVDAMTSNTIPSGQSWPVLAT